MPKKHTIENCHKLASDRGGKFLSEVYVGANTNHKWQCKNEHIWHARYGNIQQGSWCPECYGNTPNTIEDCHKLAKKRNGKCLSEKYTNNKAYYTWECEKGHQWKAKYDNIRNGSWCPKCFGTPPHAIEDCHRLAEKRGGKFLSKEYRGCDEKHKWQCGKGHEPWDTTYCRVNNGHWCPECGQLEAARKVNNPYILHHWLTNEELVCQGSWEKKVVEHFNKNKTNFHWQSKTFKMPSGGTYRPDCYLPDQDLWIEIKGYFRKDAKEKWDWFVSEHPNSELWNESKLKQLNIL